VDMERDEIRWASAGHDPVLQFLPGHDGGHFRELQGGDYPLGVMDKLVYQEYRTAGLAKGSVLLIGTDGIWEARNPDGEMFGKDRLRNVIRANAEGSADEIAEAIERSVRVFGDGRAIQDDITFVVVKVRGKR
jgi:phosphoserine phosphatase RsbU/P